MPDIRINPNEVQRQGERRLSFRAGLVIHAAAYMIVNVILWLVWALAPRSATLTGLLLVITFGWLVVLIVHAAIVLLSHSPRQAAHDEVRREVKEQQLQQTTRPR